MTKPIRGSDWKIFSILIDAIIHLVEHENNKNNYEKLSVLINQFLQKN